MKKSKSLIVVLSVIAVVLLAVSCGNGTPTPRFSEFTLYTVTVKSGDYIVDDVVVIEGNTYSLPVGPERAGYSFVGWNVGEQIMSPGEKITVTKDTEIEAYWAKSYHCIVDYAYYSYSASYDVAAGTKVKISDWDITDVAKQFNIANKFTGWNLNGTVYHKDVESEWNQTVEITQDSTMTAIWDGIEYWTVTFQDENGTQLYTRLIKKDTAIGETNSPYKEGYSLKQWNDESGNAFDLSTFVTKNMTLKAVMEKTSCVVTLVFDNGKADQKHIVTTGEMFYELKDPEKDNFDFAGWYKDDGTKFDFSTPIEDDITLTAHWEHRTTYTVTFDTMGGSEVEPIEVAKNNLIFKPSDPTRKGYTFGGWYLADGTAFNFNSMLVTENLTLYALWNLDKEYKIGDTGLGGGLVFYDAGSLQISSYVDMNGVTRIYTWRYLEVNPDVKGTANWSDYSILGELGGGLGLGRSNTMKMARHGSDAAKIAVNCKDGGVEDWFIPSLNELAQILKVKDEIGLTTGQSVWSSTSFTSSQAHYTNLGQKCHYACFKYCSWSMGGPFVNCLLVRAF